MQPQTRRDLLRATAAVLSTTGFAGALTGWQSSYTRVWAEPVQISVESWMDEWIKTKGAEGTIHVARFKDPIYVLTRPIAWVPNPGQTPSYKRVDVPVGFVTDFASIPRVFFSMLRPDGNYTFAAIVHDFLYWSQDRSRDEADDIFRLSMQDLSIPSITIEAIYMGVRRFGESAWNVNAEEKRAGGKRVLKRLPQDARVTWADWRIVPDVFE